MGDVSTVGPFHNANLGPAVTAWAPSSARRCLFGVPNPKKLRTILAKETKEMLEEGKARWNFDFVTGVPLDCGRYAWTKIGSDLDKSDADQIGSSTETSSNEDIVLQQTLITDYMRKRKLSTNQTMTSVKAKSKAKRRSST